MSIKSTSELGSVKVTSERVVIVVVVIGGNPNGFDGDLVERGRTSNSGGG